jgi:hypothetical protein
LDAVINLEMICHQFEFTADESVCAIAQLAQTGYLEPLEFEGDDPLFGLVANHAQVKLLNILGAALKVPQYRMAVITLILARERVAH